MTPEERQGFEKRNRAISRMVTSAKADLMLRYFSIKEATKREDAVWQPFQVDVLNCTAFQAIMLKSRQIGESFTLAGDALADGLVKQDLTVVATSFNLEECKEKVRYLSDWWGSRALDPQNVPAFDEFGDDGLWKGDQGNRVTGWPSIVRTNTIYFELSNGFRFFSNPAKPPRGKKASALLDELAITMNAAAIYTAAIGMVTRGRGQCTVRVCSTPLGAKGQFHDIWSDEKTYENFVRMMHGWWEIFDLCPKENYFACKEAYAAGMDPEEMVRRYGTEWMKKLVFGSMDLDTFLQEYHLQFLDALYSFLPLDLIVSCYPPMADLGDDYLDEDPDELEKYFDGMYLGFKAVATWNNAGKGEDQMSRVYAAIDALSDAVRRGDVREDLAFTFDCGRTRDASEITVFGVQNNIKFNQRLMVTLRNVPFEQQKAVIEYCFKVLPIRRGMFDRGGIGMQLAEWAEKAYGYLMAKGVDFNQEIKNDWAVTLKMEMERRHVTLIYDKDQQQQLHSVQRKAATVGRLFQYVVDEQKSNVGGGKVVHHHADKFWTVAMGVWLCVEMARGSTQPASGGETQSPGISQHAAKVRRPGEKSAARATRKGFGGLGRG